MNPSIGAISNFVEERKLKIKKYLKLNFYENGSDYTQTIRLFCPNIEIFKKNFNK